ncbi:armadillo-type protein [Daldinia vernicosa]|uniref:armadillo-type protein n=1 Tax=Daldinia vernicosa TaxID=114800 RepID=UPI002007CACA|nr:armadillo-type protein [Daldinia vernicosa]KAI0851143.1 armadillo-type protein [Daldinia vernicosa]
MELLSRPRTTEELIERLKRLELGLDNQAVDNDPTIARQRPTSERNREATALRSLLYSMVQTFYNNPERSYAVEAALLSPFCNEESYALLFNAFANSVAADSSGSGIPDINVLNSFSIMLRSTQVEHIGQKLPLGYAIQSLTNRLTTACSAADDVTQYVLLRTLSTILDVMNEVKFEGISDTQIMQPLFDLLENVSGHPELRLSQAARYAKQALRGIHSDVSPWEKLAKSVWNVIKGGAAIAGSVGTLDPNKLLEGLEALGEVANMVKLITDVIDEVNSIRDINKGVQNLKSPRQWYVALRFTDLIIRGRRNVLLGSLLESLKPSLRKDEDFLCGLCALLEQAIHHKADGEVIKVLRGFLTDQRAISKSARVHGWVDLVAGPAKSTKLSMPKRLLSKLHLAREYHTTLGYQQTPSQTPGNVLLEKAWPTCHEAKVFYADQMIRNYYTNETVKRLNIERLGTNHRLPMEKCYINLAIVQQEEKENRGIEPSSLLFHRRLAIWKPNESDRVSLVDLFRPQKDAEKANKVDYRRVLIRGQAGVGKSTLCKKIVYDHIYNEMWSEIINRVIWLPLRQLKGQDMQKYDIQRLLFERYFSNNSQDGKLLVEALHDEISKEGSRTLFILDGLDEVLQELSSGESELLLSLLQQTRVIITTRPYAVRQIAIENIDREFETIGFYDEQVSQYIEAVAPDNAKTIQSFLSNHPRVEELARIPIQLDAFCYSFEQEASDKGKGPRTMTQLYNATESIIWKKDVVRLEKRLQGRLETITKGVAVQLNLKETRDLIQGEVNVLQALAFDAIIRGTEEFDSKYMENFLDRQNDLTEYLAKPKYDVFSIYFKEFSFLRTSDRSSAAKNNSYHFLHLTFQEYFAAQYFVQHWPDRQLPQLGMSTAEFLRREKYNPRFDIMWRFVTGLLHAKGDAKKFFEIIETEPYDLLGFTHHRLVLHCLEEVVELREIADFYLRDNLEYHLSEWLLFGLRFTRETHSEWEFGVEYPEKMLRQCLSATDDESLQCIVLDVLQKRPIISSDTVNKVTEYCESSDPELIIKALQVLLSCKYTLPGNCFHTITNLIEDSDPYIKELASAILLIATDLPEATFSELIVYVNQGDTSTRFFALTLLELLPLIPEKTLLEMVVIIPDLDVANTKSIMKIFRNQGGLSDHIVLKMLDLIQRRRLKKPRVILWDKRAQARPWITAKQSGRIAPRVVEKLLNMLKDPNSTVRKDVAYAFCGYKLKEDPDLLHKIMGIFEEPDLSDGARLVLSFNEDLPENIIHKMVDYLENHDTGIQSAATRILASQYVKFSMAILQRIGSLLNNPRKRRIATKALRSQRSLPEQILQTILDQFKDPRTRLHDQELILSTQSSMPDSILQQLIALLQVEDERLQKMITDVLLSIRLTFPEMIIRKLAVLLDCESIDIQYTAMQALSKQSSLPREVLRKVVSNIRHHDESSVKNIIKKMRPELVRQFVVMPEIVLDTIRLLSHPSYPVQYRLIRSMERIPNLPDGILEEMVHLLGVMNQETSANGKILDAVVAFFCNRKPDSLDSVLEELARLFNHSNKDARDAVASIFARQRSVLSKEILQIMTLQLNNFEARVLNDLSSLLGLQPVLPEAMLQDLIAMLNHPEEDIGYAAANIITKSLAQSDATFNLLFDLLEEQSFIRLYAFWMKESLQKHITWCVDGKNSIISLPGRDRSIPLDKFKGAVRKARESFGVPYKDFGQVL